MQKQIESVLDEAAATVTEFSTEADRYVEPYRKNVFKRFPTLFMLLVSFGVAAVFFGFERIIEETLWLNERPWLILALGLTALVLTGRLYKKLD